MLQRFAKQAFTNLQDQRRSVLSGAVPVERKATVGPLRSNSCRQAEKSVQQVVEVLAPGPLGVKLPSFLDDCSNKWDLTSPDPGNLPDEMRVHLTHAGLCKSLDHQAEGSR